MMKVDWVARTDPVARATAMLTAANPIPNSSVSASNPSDPTTGLAAKRTPIANPNSNRTRL